MYDLSYIDGMAMTKKTVGLIVVLITVALAGLIMLQVYLLESSVTLKEQAFRRDVVKTLGTVVEALEARETARTAIEFGTGPSGSGQIAIFARMSRDSDSTRIPLADILNCGDSLRPTIQQTDDGFVCSVPSPRHVIVQLLDSSGRLDTTLMDQFCQEGAHLLDPGIGKSDSNLYTFRIISDSIVSLETVGRADTGNIWQTAAADSAKIDFTVSVLNRLLDLERRPIEDRLDSAILDSVLEDHLVEAGFEEDYVYGVIGEGDSLWRGPDDYANELAVSEYRARLFPHDLFAPRFDLALHFPGHQVHIWKQMSPMLLSTIAFLGVLIYCFISVIRALIAQKRNAALMVDFINNMTHEFKTPISTVALACEAIMRPDIISDNEKVTRYSKLIHDENRRMRSQTEKILQMAALEEGDLDLKRTDVDLHGVIRDAVDNITIQVESRGGRITCSLEAGHHVVQGDAVHLSNIVFNLLDNANKYSPEKPSISVSTWNEGSGMYLRIEDRGKGIREEHIKSVFKKYYRVPTGNVHDVKGFGLGLSYVKLITEAHGGRISLTSKPGEGTRVDVFLPVLKEEIGEVPHGA